MWMKNRLWDRQLWTCEIIERLPNMMVLVGPKLNSFLHPSNMVADIFKYFMPPFKNILATPLNKLYFYDNTKNRFSNSFANFLQISVLTLWLKGLLNWVTLLVHFCMSFVVMLACKSFNLLWKPFVSCSSFILWCSLFEVLPITKVFQYCFVYGWGHIADI